MYNTAIYNKKEHKKSKTWNDVTTEWLEYANPNSHKVAERKYYIHNGRKYKISKFNKNVILDYSDDELKTAMWLENTFGGEIYLNPRINVPENIDCADYLWNGELWDRKGMRQATSLKRAVDNAIKDHKSQSSNFIIDLTGCILTNETIIRQVKNTFDENNKLYRYWVQKIVIKRNDKLIKVFIKK